MVDIVRKLLFVASGIPSTCPRSGEIVWEIVVRELRPLVDVCYSDIAAEDSDADGRRRSYRFISAVIKFLSPNMSSLHRFVRRLITMDAVQEHSQEITQDEMNVPEKNSGARTSIVQDALAELGWTSDAIQDYLNEPDGPVRRARMARADRISLAMSRTGYEVFCAARLTSFTADVQQCSKIQGRSRDHWTAAVFPWSLAMPPDVLEVVALLAAEIVYLIVDLVFILRADTRDGTFLRYSALCGGADFSAVWSSLGTFDMSSNAVNVAETRNVARLFCSNFLGNSAHRSLLLLL